MVMAVGRNGSWRSSCSARDERLEPAEEHALSIQQHLHTGHAWVLHGFGVDLVTMGPRAISDYANEDGLVGFQGDALRERRDLSRGRVVGLDLDARESAVLAPDLHEGLGLLAISLDILLRDRDDEEIEIFVHDGSP